jgi:hypothetical protein
MQKHLNAEHDLYRAAFEVKNARLVPEHNLPAVELLQRSAELSGEFDLHMRSEHDVADGLQVIREATQS